MLRSQSTGELLRAAAILRLCRYDAVTQNSEKLMARAERLLGRRLFHAILRRTAYGHFVAGEDLASMQRVADRLAKDNMRTMFYTHIESDEGGDDLSDLHEHNTQILLDTVDIAPPNSMTQVKFTGIANLDMLKSVTSAMNEANLMPFSDRSALVKTSRNPAALIAMPESVKEKHGEDIVAIQDRLHRLAERAAENRSFVIFDAEQTYFQPAIQRLVLPVMLRCNTRSRPIVYTTIQAYLKESEAVAQGCLDLCQQENSRFATKVVRGAYIVQELERARTHAYPSPLLPSYEETNRSYNRIVENLIDSVGKNSASVMVATHNRESVAMAQKLMMKQDIPSGAGSRVCFAQIYGLAEYLSSELAASNYIVYKSVPSGPIDKVMGYLSRRAQENSAVFSRFDIESKHIWLELRRRFSARR